jgi:hypothetical protein
MTSSLDERHLTFVGKCKTKSIVLKMENDLICFGRWKTISNFSKCMSILKIWQMEGDLNVFANGRQPHLENRRQLKSFGKGKFPEPDIYDISLNLAFTLGDIRYLIKPLQT